MKLFLADEHVSLRWPKFIFSIIFVRRLFGWAPPIKVIFFLRRHFLSFWSWLDFFFLQLLLGVESLLSATVSLEIVLLDEGVAVYFFSGGFGPRRIHVIISWSFLGSCLGFPIVKSGVVLDRLILGLVSYFSDGRSIHVIIVALLFCLGRLLPTPMLLMLFVFTLCCTKSILALSQARSCLFMITSSLIVTTTVSLHNGLQFSLITNLLHELLLLTDNATRPADSKPTDCGFDAAAIFPNHVETD